MSVIDNAGPQIIRLGVDVTGENLISIREIGPD